MSLKFRPSVLVVSLAAAFALACGGGGEAPVEAEPKAVVGQEDIVVLGTQRIASGPRISGTLEPVDKALIRSEVAGSVVSIGAEVGQRVQKGDVLGQIESGIASDGQQSARSGYSAAQEDLAFAERELERSKRLSAAGALPAREVERAESAVLSAKARVADARSRMTSAGEQLGATSVRAPFAGVVSERSVGAGDIVSPGSPLFTVIEPGRLRLEGAVPADAVHEVAVGATVRFEVQGHPGEWVEGTIERIAPAVDPVTRLIPVLVTVPNEEGRLMAGLFAEGRVATQQREGFVVPSDALEEGGDEATVLRVREGKVERVAVAVGLRDDDAEQVELTEGVTTGDVILVGAARELSPGTAVEVRPATEG